MFFAENGQKATYCKHCSDSVCFGRAVGRLLLRYRLQNGDFARISAKKPQNLQMPPLRSLVFDLEPLKEKGSFEDVTVASSADMRPACSRGLK
jgi:DNA polymerase elongation subunit (family B)